ncbi:hypothetical protein STEG23_027610 [Scotinomys teguina]
MDSEEKRKRKLRIHPHVKLTFLKQPDSSGRSFHSTRGQASILNPSPQLAEDSSPTRGQGSMLKLRLIGKVTLVDTLLDLMISLATGASQDLPYWA